MRLKNVLTVAIVGLGLGCGVPATHPDLMFADQRKADQEALAALGLAPSPAAEAELKHELDLLWELQMQTFPQWASYRGDRRFDDRLNDDSEEAAARFLNDYQAIAERIAAIPSQTLSADSQDTQAMVAIAIRNRRNKVDTCRYDRWTVNGLGGPQVGYPMLSVFFSVRNSDDLENLESRYRATGVQIDQNISNLRLGLSAGYAPTRVNVERAIRQLEDVLKTPIDKDPMLTLNLADPKLSLDTKSLKSAVTEVVRPALTRYLDVLRTEVLPQAREKVGVSEIPNGAACYQVSVESHIGPGFSPQQLHQIGLDELKWAHDGMMVVATDLGLKPKDVRGFMREMTRDPNNFVKDEAKLLEINRDAVKRATAALPKMFKSLPKTPVEVRPIEAHRAPSAPAAYYNSAPADGSRPGIYYCNTYEPETRPLYNVEALAYHEANPGHHHQIALAQELPSTHVWRQNAGQTAFSEGWALYAEILADEMDLYSSPRAKFGMYNYQAWRAARLVVDTGLHSMGWTRQQAIDFLTENTALKPNEIENEIDRYIAWPGQALAYMVGRRKIQELRTRATKALGDRFDIRAFHDEVIGHGSVPLELLEKNIDTWIAQATSQD